MERQQRAPSFKATDTSGDTSLETNTGLDTRVG